jgi:hypothetical protein
MMEGGWAYLPDELLAKVLEAATQEGGLGFTKASAKLRLVCAQWQTVRDALVRRLVMTRRTTDEAVGMLVRRFPAVASLEKSCPGWRVLTDTGLRAVSNLASLTSMDLSYCSKVTDKGCVQ